MRETVEKILNGIFDYEKGTLDFQATRLELALKPSEVFTGSFTIDAPAGKTAEGTLYCDDLRMQLINDSFSGAHSEIGYSFSAVGLEEGDVVQGEIYVISNQGEYYLPYVVTVRHESIESSLGSIKNLFHFTNLAKSNWDEAVRLFYSPDFMEIFAGNDLQYRKTYLGLSHYFANEQNVEEFLLSINKKQPIEYIPEREVISLDNPTEIMEECINITRNGWGYTVLNVQTDSDFVLFEKHEITDNDFLGNYVSFPVYINPDKLHGGTNYAKVTFFNAFASFDVRVVVNVDVCTKQELSKHLEFQRAQVDMLTFYEAFRTKKIGVDTWIAETGRVVDRMLQLDDKSLTARLFKAQLLMTEERNNEAKWILDQAEAEFQEMQEFSSSRWAYYLYLTTLYSREESYIDSITDEVFAMFDNDRTQWKMAWILLYLSEDFAVSPSKKWIFIEETIELGCTSPMFYVEAVNMLIANPSLLSKLTDFEIRVLNYAAANDLLTNDMIGQFVYLAAKEKRFNTSVLRILEKCYELLGTDEILSAICELLIKGEKHDASSYEWYLLAIKKELRITKLYEYYMQSLDLSKEYDIPKMVYLYFSYESELDWEHNAYLFSHVFSKREEMPDVFDTYRPMIERFAIEEILKGSINKNMAVIYRNVLAEMKLTDEMAEMLSKLLFVHRISIEDERITKVIVYQSRESIETSYPVRDCSAFIPIYNKEFTILFEDGFSNRYCASIDYDLEKLMVPGKLAAIITPYVKDNLQFDVYVCECSSEMIEINSETRERYKRILESPVTDKEYASSVRTKLMKYYYENDEIRELDGVLEELDPLELNKRDRINAIGYMIIRGMYDKALEWIRLYGPEDVDVRERLKLCSKLVTRGEYEYDVLLVKLCAGVFFGGKYDENILKYLVKWYAGMTKNVRKVFKAAENFSMDIYELCEKLLVQMLHTGYYVSERMDIYRKYIQGGADNRIQNAFLTQCAYDYFVREQIMDDFVFEELTKMKLRGEDIQTVSKLAYLKYHADSADSLDETVKGIVMEYLEGLLDEGIYMSFFKNYMEKTTPGINKFTDKTIIEYKTEPGRRVWIHYVIESGQEIDGEYLTEEMHEMYGGVHAKAFILFFGENLLYYITEESDGEELLTESQSIQKSDISRDIFDSRFNEVNDIVIAKTLEDYETANRLLYDYHKHAYIIKKLFTLE